MATILGSSSKDLSREISNRNGASNSAQTRRPLQPISANIPRIGERQIPIQKPGSVAGSTTSVKSTKLPDIKLQLPLQLGNQEDLVSDNDEEEDRHLMTILQKLKEVQTTTTESKQRKRAREFLDESFTNFSKEVKTMIAKHNRKWDTKHSQIMERHKKIKTSLHDLLKASEEKEHYAEETLKKLQTKINQAQQFINQVETSLVKSQTEWDQVEKSHINAMRNEIEAHMELVKEHFLEIHRKSLKDDKLSRLIKTFLSTF